MFGKVTILAQANQVVGIQGNLCVPDILGTKADNVVHFFSRISASGTFEPVPLEDIGTDGLPLFGIIKLLSELSCHSFNLP